MAKTKDELPKAGVESADQIITQLDTRMALLRDGLVAARDELIAVDDRARRSGIPELKHQNNVLAKIMALLALPDKVREIGAAKSDEVDAMRAQIATTHYRESLKEIRALSRQGSPIQLAAEKALAWNDPESEVISKKIRIFNAWAGAQLARERLYTDDGSGPKLAAGRTDRDVDLAESDIRRHARDAISLLMSLEAEGRE